MRTVICGTHLRSVLILALVLPWVSGQGCPTPVNPPPVADAGPDQVVAVGTLVTLDGSASFDPDGEPITFDWTQSAGTKVVLTGATTAKPTFTAPGVDAVLDFQLAVTDSRGASDADTVRVTVQSSVTPSPQLFVANRTSSSVTSYRNPATLDGNIPPDTNLIGGNTQLGQPTDMVVTKGGSLLASNFLSSALTIYPNGRTVTGNVAPERVVKGDATLLESVTSLEVDVSRDLVYLSEIGFINRIVVFANVSTSGFNGNVAPARTIASGNMVNPLGIHLAANDDLYVANNGPGNVVVFAKASTLDGYVLPTRTLSSGTFGAVVDVDVDAGDRLYVLNGALGNNQVSIFNTASKLSGFVTANAVLVVPGATSLAAMEIDIAGTGYVLDSGAAAIYVYDKIATRNGTIAPDRKIQGANTQLSAPVRLFLLE